MNTLRTIFEMTDNRKRMFIMVFMVFCSIC